MDACDQPTIEEILLDYGVNEYLHPVSYQELLSALQDRDIVMRSDAASSDKEDC